MAVFTGIVLEMGAVESVSTTGDSGSGRRFEFAAPTLARKLNVGDSVAVNGCCLTAVEVEGGPAAELGTGLGTGLGTELGSGLATGRWLADAVEETLSRTNLGDLEVGDAVNLELPLGIGDVLGGHLVQGHVDGVGRVLDPAPDLRVSLPPSLARYVVEKGSVTVDGVSLTVVTVDDDSFAVAVIPHTMGATTLGRRVAGELVNLEVDVIAKYVERLLSAGAITPYLPSTPDPPAAAGAGVTGRSQR